MAEAFGTGFIALPACHVLPSQSLRFGASPILEARGESLEYQLSQEGYCHFVQLALSWDPAERQARPSYVQVGHGPLFVCAFMFCKTCRRGGSLGFDHHMMLSIITGNPLPKTVSVPTIIDRKHAVGC